MTAIVESSESSDFASWLAACHDSDPAALASLYNRYRPMLERFAARNGASDPEGVANLAFYDGVRAIKGLRSRSERSFRSYIFRAASSRILSEKRKGTLDVTALGDEDPSLPDTGIDEMIVEANWVQGLVAELSDDQREVINDRFFVGYSTVETARRLGKSPGAVRKLQHDAIARLRHALVVVGALTLLMSGLFALNRVGRDDGLILESPPVGPPEDLDSDVRRLPHRSGSAQSAASEQLASSRRASAPAATVAGQRRSDQSPTTTAAPTTAAPTTVATEASATSSSTTVDIGQPVIAPVPIAASPSAPTPGSDDAGAPSPTPACEVSGESVRIGLSGGQPAAVYYFFGSNKKMLHRSDELVLAVGTAGSALVWSAQDNSNLDPDRVRFISTDPGATKRSGLVSCQRAASDDDHDDDHDD